MKRRKNHTNQMIFELNQSCFGVKAEALVAHVVQAGTERESFLLLSNSFFNRPFLKDIVKIELPLVPSEAGWLRTTLSRPGLYDALPEGLFFQPGSSQINKQQAVPEMAAMYRQNKKKEHELRSFFQPFEQGGFYQRLQLEEEECRLTQGLESGVLHQYLRDFWSIPAKIRQHDASVFLRLIPYAHRITSDLERMEEVLRLLLPGTVRLTLDTTGPCLMPKAFMRGLGEQTLGVDMVCGQSFIEPTPVFRLLVGLVEREKVHEFLEGGYMDLILKTFARFFVPADAEMMVDIELSAKKPEMNLTAGAEPIMGFTTCL